jgi:hypothetical protein
MPLADFNVPKHSIGADFEALTPSPSAKSFEMAGIPPQASTPLQSFTRTPRRSSLFSTGEPIDKHVARSFRGSFPFSVFPAVQSNLTPASPNPPVTLRPQGFAPSRRFAPRTTSRAYFIPVPLLGFTPRGLDPRATPYAVSDAGPLLGFPPVSEEPGRPSRGPTRRAKPVHVTRGLAWPSLRCLHELHPLRGVLPSAIARSVNPASPLTCFLDAVFTLTSPPAPQGLYRRRRSRSLSRPARPPWSSLPL